MHKARGEWREHSVAERAAETVHARGVANHDTGASGMKYEPDVNTLLIVVQLVALAFSYGRLRQSVTDLASRVGRIESVIDAKLRK